ncbi:uncharacterized protein EV420DRAFT_1762745 [Desarmillaria tabescens]|uniref:Uncharacterized protein n=1 Tax=Armillaria tabescens TaxID=1929756 RepID=A0AA39TIW5_ARMTA|nr:uncharacterized protein EV420DRAFT_1762745 [Desarmillaria tabescens]KAK0460482.1 hypothetical protein EV420DRAFT_1762745 [Desarmillaria tabescens]
MAGFTLAFRILMVCSSVLKGILVAQQPGYSLVVDNTVAYELTTVTGLLLEGARASTQYGGGYINFGIVTCNIVEPLPTFTAATAKLSSEFLSEHDKPPPECLCQILDR